MNGSCLNCGGLIMEPGKTYGYAGPVCHCPKDPNKVYQNSAKDLNREKITKAIKEGGVLYVGPNQSKVFTHIHELGEWVYAHEPAIVQALKMMTERLPISQISSFERALDSIPKLEG